MDKAEAQEMANKFAEDAHDNHFSERRGVWEIEDADCLVIFNNNPFSIDT